jgi:hypothetical protein
MQVKIERQSGAKWLATSSVMLDDEVIGRVEVAGKVTRTAALVCQPGVFRGAARSQASHDGKRYGWTDWSYTRPEADPCG